MTEQKHASAYQIWQPLLLAACVVAGMFAGTKLQRHPASEKPLVQTIKEDKGRELNEIVRFIEEKYVDKVDADKLISGAIQALIKDLDPHSGYLSPEEVRKLNEKMEGKFEGIGIEFHKVLDTAVVLYVIPETPAEKAGLKMYDRIVNVNDSSMVGSALSEVEMVDFLRGEKASTVEIEIARPGVDSLITIRLDRDVIPIKSIESAYMIDKEVGYFRIRSFNARTYREFMDHLERLHQQEHMRDLIIDLRQNPGGYLKEAVNILSQFFEEKGLLLVYTEGEHASRAEYKTTGKPFFPIENIVVLVDDGSASASEIVAGALQDNDRAVILGTPTYGKGLVQEQYALSNGGALRLTIARYFTPSGRLIQKPYHNGNSVSEHGQSDRDTTSYFTVQGRPVRGSGGITPDILVEWDFNWFDSQIYQLYYSVLEFALYGYRDTTQYTSIDDLLARFPDEETIHRQITAYFMAKPEEAQINTEIFSQHTQHTRMILMAMIGADRFGENGWTRVMNNFDPVVQKALEVIKQDLQITLKLD